MSNAVLIIVIVSIVFGVLHEMYKKYLEYKAQTLAHNDNSNQQNNALTQQIEQLSERIQVLEKIVTDEGYQVQKDIHNL